MMAAGVAYLHVMGPTFGFFGLGLSLFFASRGAGRLGWTLLAMTGSLGSALVVYGVKLTVAVASGVWFRAGSGMA